MDAPVAPTNLFDTLKVVQETIRGSFEPSRDPEPPPYPTDNQARTGIDVRGYAAILVPGVVRDLADADFGLCHPDSSGMPENVGRDAFQPGILRGRS